MDSTTFLQFAESSIAQLEKTRSSQQSQIQSLQMQVQGLETSVEVLGHFMLQLLEKNNGIDCPDDVRRIVQQISTLDSQRKKPIFLERKIGKSMSVNGNLGFPLKVLEELNESADKENGSSPRKAKSAFFENTYQQLRKQNSRHRLGSSDDDRAEKSTSPGKSAANGMLAVSEGKPDGLDSGIATPISPKENSITSIVETIPSTAPSSTSDASMRHPFGNCEDVNFRFNGTTQLKSIRPIHLRTSIAASQAADERIDGRS